MDRPTVDQYFIDMTHLVKGRGTCPRRQVGAVVVKDKRVLTTGYNGAPRGFPHPCDTGCIRDELQIPSGMMADVCPCLHAEQNAIIQAATTGVSIEGADIYCTTQPCTQCSRMIANCGLRRVVFEEEYADPLSIGLLVTAGVELWKWDARSGEAHRYGLHNTFEEAQDALRKRWAGHPPEEATQEDVRRTIQQEMAVPLADDEATSRRGATPGGGAAAGKPRPAGASAAGEEPDGLEAIERDDELANAPSHQDVDDDEEPVAVEGLRRLEGDPERQDIIRRMAATRKQRLQRALDEDH